MFVTFNSHRSNTILGKTIRFFSRGKFNHTSINLNGIIYEAHIWCGVRMTQQDIWDNSTVKTSTTFDIDVHTHRKLHYWLNRQVGKDYDLWGVLSFIWRFAKPTKGKWFCSELAVVVLAKLFALPTYNQRQSPTDFYYFVQAIYKITTDR
jgi:hypothetical protein